MAADSGGRRPGGWIQARITQRFLATGGLNWWPCRLIAIGHLERAAKLVYSGSHRAAHREAGAGLAAFASQVSYLARALVGLPL